MSQSLADHLDTLGGLPSTDEEVWRYSRIADLDVDGFHLGAATRPAPGEVPERSASALGAMPERAATVVVVDGIVAWSEVHDPAVSVAVETVTEPVAEPTDVFFRLNDLVATERVVITVGRGASAGTVAVVHWMSEPGLAVVPRTVVRVGEGASLTVVEHHSSAGGTPGLSVPVVELDVERGGRLGYLGVQDLGLATWQLGTVAARVGQEANLVAATASFGGDYARLRTDCRLAGRGASGDLLAVYFGEGDQTLDFRTFQDHAAPDTTSNLLFKGAVGDRSRSVYTGLIRVRKEGRGTNAFQTNRNIKLSEEAWAESVPNLEIENNEVSCSHASAVGPIDEDQRFYLESRGIPTAVAERLVVAGFFDEVIERMPVPAAAPALRALVAGKLDRRGIGT